MDGQLLKTACGSPCYAAPEMIAGKKYKGLETDIWSSGIILFAMICGYLPFEDKSTPKLYEKILKGEFSIPSHVSTEAKDLLRRLLTVDPRKRITISEIKEHIWLKINHIDEEEHTETPDINEEIIDRMTQLNIKKEYIWRCLTDNKHNHITATYHLLSKKFMKQTKKESIKKDDINLNNEIDSDKNKLEKLLNSMKKPIQSPYI